LKTKTRTLSDVVYAYIRFRGSDLYDNIVITNDGSIKLLNLCASFDVEL